MAMEQTYLMIKPDGVQRGLCGEILSRFEKKGLKLVAMKLMVIPKETAEKHYAEHKGYHIPEENSAGNSVFTEKSFGIVSSNQIIYDIQKKSAGINYKTNCNGNPENSEHYIN